MNIGKPVAKDWNRHKDNKHCFNKAEQNEVK